jgi:hypothetical protein
VIVLLSSALALASCRAAGPSGSIGPSTNDAEPSASPSPAAVASDAATAADTVAAYLAALAAAQYAGAWRVLAPSAREAWGSEQQFATERGLFYASAGPAMVKSAPDNSAATLAAWLLPSFDGNRRRAYVVNVDHPQIQSNASREVLVAAPDSSGDWHIWISR